MPFIRLSGRPLQAKLKKKNMNYPKNIEISMEKVKELTSTNDYLAQLCKESKAKEFYTVVAESQTAGKGQRGNHWESEAGKNLTLSMVLYPTALEVKKHFCLSMLTALSCFEALGHYTDGFSIKWPNDIYWKDKKIGGILIENELEGGYITQSILGIGLNVNQEEFRSSAPNPISLKQIVGTDIDLQEVLNKVVHNIIGGYRQLENDYDTASLIIRTLYLRNLFRKKGLHPYRDAEGEFMASFHDLTPEGYLVLKDEQDNLRKYAFKEVAFIL